MIDELIGNADAFPVLRHWDFYNHAGVSPLPRVAADVLRTFATEAERGAYLETKWYREVEQLRDSTARLINANRDEIALVKNTSEGLSIVANGIDWRPGDRIVTTAIEYPANVYPWMDLAQRFGVVLVTVPPEVALDGSRRVSNEALLRAADHPRTRLLTLSHVQFSTGQRHDLIPLGRSCRERGVLFAVDAIQTLGVLPVDVQLMNIDYLSADGHKWLLGPEGAGVFYCRRELIPQTRVPTIGWMNVANALNYDRYDFTLKPNAAKFECGSWNVPGFLSLRASMELLMSARIEVVARRVQGLTDRLITGLRSVGYKIASPRDGTEWSGIVSFSHPSLPPDSIPTKLRKEHRIEIVLRGTRLRASPHFYNTEAQIDRLVDVLSHV